jgi:hypothetical protein
VSLVRLAAERSHSGEVTAAWRPRFVSGEVTKDPAVVPMTNPRPRLHGAREEGERDRASYTTASSKRRRPW